MPKEPDPSAMPQGHGPLERPLASHRWSSTRDVRAHRRAVRVTAIRNWARLTVQLELHRVGHAYPTGDLLRRVRVHAEGLDEHGAVVGKATRYLARHFAIDQNGQRIQLADDRIRPHRPTRVELDLGNPAGLTRIRYSVELERVLHLAPEGDDAVVASAIELASGVL